MRPFHGQLLSDFTEPIRFFFFIKTDTFKSANQIDTLWKRTSIILKETIENDYFDVSLSPSENSHWRANYMTHYYRIRCLYVDSITSK